MAVFDHLTEVLDQRKDSNECVFNGYLEDYLGMQEGFAYHDLFQEILNIDPEFRICVGFGFNVNREVISNQIIRYKDASKLPDRAMRCPYILYLKTDDFQRAIIFAEDDDYLYAKGFYYCLTEQYALLEDSRNEIVAMSLDNQNLVREKVGKFLKKESRAGAIQREIDGYYFNGIHELIDLALKKATDLRDRTKDDLLALEERGDYIYDVITKWYLLKKVVYVSYMMNKMVLREECDNEIKKQRYNAKIYSDKIPFMALSEMWRLEPEGAQPTAEPTAEPETETTPEPVDEPVEETAESVDEAVADSEETDK